jgi:pilus assembly protein CpaB
MLQMRSRTIVLLGSTVALAGAITVFSYARSVTGAGGDSAASAFVATNDISAGTKGEAAVKAMAQRSVPASLRPAASIGSKKDLTGLTSVRRIAKGEVVTSTQFGRSGSAPAAGLEIPAGKNAVTMSVAPPQGVAHYAQPGDAVNLFVTLKDSGGGTITKLLLSNTQVLSNHSAVADQRAGVSGGGGEVLLTLALTPGQAEKVIFAKENGSLWFGLVHAGDSAATTAGRTAGNVFR